MYVHIFMRCRRPAHQAYIMVYRTLTAMLVLPWPETTHPAQRWDARAQELTKLVGGATKFFQQLQRTPNWSEDSRLQSQGTPAGVWWRL